MGNWERGRGVKGRGKKEARGFCVGEGQAGGALLGRL